MAKKISNSKIQQAIKTWVSAKNDAKNSMLKAFRTGEILNEIKKEADYGDWGKLFKEGGDFYQVFSLSHADTLIKISTKQELISLIGGGELLTIKEMDRIISQATPEQIARAEQLRQEEEAKRQQAEAENQRKAEERQAQQEQAKPKEPEIIEGEFKEIKQELKQVSSVAEHKPDDSEQLRDLLSEQLSVNAAIQQDNDSLVKVFEANDQLAQATSEIKRLNEINRALQDRLNGALNTEAEMKRTIRYWEGRCKKLEKQLEASNVKAA